MGNTFRWQARHTVLSILFATWIVSYLDRIVMSVAIPYIAADYHLSPLAMGIVMSVFFAGYSISQIPGGVLADKFGVRKVATLAMLWWSVFTAATGAAGNLTQMLIIRFVFGLGEGVFPACAFKSIAGWFPTKERATANAIMLASNSLGAALAPLAAVGILSLWGWRALFYILFVPGLVVSLLFWKFVLDRPDDEPALDRHTDARTNIFAAVREPNVLKLFLVLFTFDVANWGFTSWLPTYLVKARGFSLVEMGVTASLPFFAGTAGYIIGGLVSDKYFRDHRRMPIVVTQLISALLLYLMFMTDSLPVLIVCQTLAGFFLKAFFSAFWALPLNTVPKRLIGITGGFINMAGQIAAFLSPLAVGYLVGAAGGRFDLTFAFLIISLLVSCALVFTLPARNSVIHAYDAGTR